MTTDLPVDVVVPAWGEYVHRVGRALASTAGVRRCIVVTDDAPRAFDAGADEVVPFSPGSGLSAAREWGLDRVTAPFVLFLDADDVLVPGAVGRMLGPLLADPSLLASACGFRRASDGQPWPPPRLGACAAGLPGVPLLLARNSLPVVGACLLRVDGLPRPLFPALEDEDWHAAVRVRARGRVHFDPTPGLEYTDRAGSVSRRPRSVGALRYSQDRLVASAEVARGRPSLLYRLADLVATPYRLRRTQTLLAAWGTDAMDGAVP